MFIKLYAMSCGNNKRFKMFIVVLFFICLDTKLIVSYLCKMELTGLVVKPTTLGLAVLSTNLSWISYCCGLKQVTFPQPLR